MATTHVDDNDDEPAAAAPYFQPIGNFSMHPNERDAAIIKDIASTEFVVEQ